MPLCQYLLDQLRSGQSSQPIPDLLNQTFHVVDGELSKLAAQGGTNSGCTAVTAFLRLEDEDGNAVELEHDPDSSIGSQVARGGAGAGSTNPDIADDPNADNMPQTQAEQEDEKKHRFGDGQTRERIKNLFTSSSSSSSSNSNSGNGGTSSNSKGQPQPPAQPDTSVPAGNTAQSRESGVGERPPARPKNLAKRTLYTANVGDARAVLSWVLYPLH